MGERHGLIVQEPDAEAPVYAHPSGVVAVVLMIARAGPYAEGCPERGELP